MALMDYVFELEGKSDDERKNTILKILENKGYEYALENFKFDYEEGTNIIFSVGTGRKEILLVSHYDAFEGSPGANDNASAIAVSLDVYRRLLEYKKKGLLNCKVKVVIFTKEEPHAKNLKGRVGSRAFVDEYKEELKRVMAVVNLELCGAGDMVGIWPVTDVNRDSKILEVIKKVFDRLDIYYETAGELPVFWADYKSFREAGINDSYCLVAMKREEKDNFRFYAESNPIQVALRSFLGVFFNKLRVNMPEILTRYHNEDDKSSHLTESSLRMMSDATFNIVVNLDRKFGKGFEKF